MSFKSVVLTPLAYLNKRVPQRRAKQSAAARPVPGEGGGQVRPAEQVGPVSGELEQAKSRLLEVDRETILRALPDRLFVFNRLGDCLDCQTGNEGSEGHGEGSSRGQNVREIEFFLGNADFIHQQIERALGSHEVQAVEYRMDRAEAVFFEARFIPLDGDEVLAIFRDVSGRKKAEQIAHLAQAELELRLEQRSNELERAGQQLARLEQDLRREIDERKRVEQQRLHDAFHDALTGLPNRALFADRLERAIERANRHPEFPFAVLILDLDRFKVINDSLGHTFGDRLLVLIAQRLEGLLRAGDTIARLGGDEFVILLEEIKDERVPRLIAGRVLEALKGPFDVEGEQVFTSGSIGIVLSIQRYSCPADVMRDGDLAMYHAKQQGKARFEVFDPSMRQHAITRLELESRLRAALERGEFRLHYQAIQSLQTGRITAFEALLRWTPPGQESVPPAEFIPVAEETGLIIPIGEWVLREACRQMRAWQDLYPNSPPLAINVNISSRQFTHPDLVGQVGRILGETGLEPDSLRLEITESTFMENVELATRIFSDLQRIGVQFQIDDFGTGYSSLSYLQQFPVNTIKIDRSFVGRIGKDGQKAEIVRTILELARDLGMGTIAEGIETEEQLNQLKDLDCQLGQGFLLARPMEPDKAEALLQAQPAAAAS
jgi:diguanylate cyclase (GGDEF)-like protein